MKLLICVTVFPRIDAAAFIYFVGQFGAATIRGRCLFEGGVYSRAVFILLGNMTRAAHPGSAQSTQPKFCQQVGKTFGVAADARGAINTETANLLAGVSEDDDDDPFAGLEEDEDELEENETVLDDC